MAQSAVCMRNPFWKFCSAFSCSFPTASQPIRINDLLLSLKNFLVVLLCMTITKHMAPAAQNTHAGLAS